MKKWTPIFLTQFLGVFNDNFLKSLICFVSVVWLTEGDASTIISLASGLLVAPFILFSPLAGLMARIYSKRKVLVAAKLMEIPIMIIAVAGFYFQQLPLVMAALFFMGLQSTLYSPSKYGLIRDIGGADGISFGAGTMEMLSFVGVLIGTVVAGLVSDFSELRFEVLSIGLLATAVLGWLTSRTIKVEEEETEKPSRSLISEINPVSFLARSFKSANQLRGLNTTVLGLAVFWFIGSMIQMNLIVYCPEQLGFTNTQTSMVIAFVAIGIGLGCWVSGLISGSRAELGLVPIGGFGLSLFLTLLNIDGLSPALFIAFLMAAAFFSGWFKVPLNAWIQERVKGRMLGQILAYNNMVVFLFILISALLFGWIEQELGSPFVFKFIAGTAWLVTVVTLVKIPAMLLRFVCFVLAHSIYRIRIKGSENIPKTSGALIIANHLSMLDALLIVASVRRQVRFVMLRKVYDIKLFTWLFKRLNMIPIEAGARPEAIQRFNALCMEEINKGHVVCIFPEGQISRTGHLHSFKKGIEHIAQGIEAPVIPLFLDNVIGSPFSFKNGTDSIYKPRFRNLKRRINVAIGNPLPHPVKAYEARQAVQHLSAEIFADRLMNRSLSKHLTEALSSRSNFVQLITEDGRKVTKQQLLKEALQNQPQYAPNESTYARLLTELGKALRGEIEGDRELAILSGVAGLDQTHNLDAIATIKSLHKVEKPFGFVSCICWPVLFEKTILLGQAEGECALVGGTELVTDFLSAQNWEHFQMVMTGPERLPTTHEQWLKNLQIDIRYGLIAGAYALPVTLNTEDYFIKDITGKKCPFPGSLNGSVGRPIPGVSAQIVGTDGSENGPDEPGMLLLKGAALGVGGWVETQLLARMNEEGFISLE